MFEDSVCCVRTSDTPMCMQRLVLIVRLESISGSILLRNMLGRDADASLDQIFTQLWGGNFWSCFAFFLGGGGGGWLKPLGIFSAHPRPQNMSEHDL